MMITIVMICSAFLAYCPCHATLYISMYWSMMMIVSDTTTTTATATTVAAWFHLSWSLLIIFNELCHPANVFLQLLLVVAMLGNGVFGYVVVSKPDVGVH